MKYLWLLLMFLTGPARASDAPGLIYGTATWPDGHQESGFIRTVNYRITS